MEYIRKKEIRFRDPVVEKVVDKFIERSDVGFKKYGRTLHDERTQGLKNLVGYLNDVQEELMDAILYIQAARDSLVDKPQCKCQVKDTKRIVWDQVNYGYVTNHT